MIDYTTYNQDQLNEALADAGKAGDLELVKYLIASPELTTHADPVREKERLLQIFPSRNPLSEACENNHLPIVQYLLNIPALRVAYEIDMDSLLFLACLQNSLDVVKYLTREQSVVARVGDLSYACERNNVEVVQYLLTETNVDIHGDNEAALCAACKNGNVELVKYLLTSPELTVHAKVVVMNAYFTPFQQACSSGNLELVQYLFDFADVRCDAKALNRASGRGNLHIVRYLLRQDFKANLQSALISAVCNEQIETADYLLGSDEINVHADLNRCKYKLLKEICEVEGDSLSYSVVAVKYVLEHELLTDREKAAQYALYHAVKHYAKNIVTYCINHFDVKRNRSLARRIKKSKMKDFCKPLFEMQEQKKRLTLKIGNGSEKNSRKRKI